MADRQLTRPRVSITVPCYHNLAQARRCVASILAQSFGEFELTLLDDGASDEYRDYAAALGDARVRYQRNPQRLGAMRPSTKVLFLSGYTENTLLVRNVRSSRVAFLQKPVKPETLARKVREILDSKDK